MESLERIENCLINAQFTALEDHASVYRVNHQAIPYQKLEVHP